MKNIPIKFRGKDCITGELLFGDLFHKNKGVFIGSAISEGYAVSEVYPDSICQLVGYDKNGAEVYEGDTVYFKSDEVKRPLRAVAGTLLYETNCSAPEFVIKGGNLHNFIKEVSNEI